MPAGEWLFTLSILTPQVNIAINPQQVSPYSPVACDERPTTPSLATSNLSLGTSTQTHDHKIEPLIIIFSNPLKVVKDGHVVSIIMLPVRPIDFT